MRLSSRLADLPLSPTLALDARAKELAAAGADVVNMAVGEPDFAAPAAAADAATAKVRSGQVKYTQANGTPGLRAAVAAHLAATRGGTWNADEVVICHSAKHALSGALMALIEPGDEVLVFQPYWVSYVELIRLAGGVPIPVPALDACRPDLAAALELAGPRARGLLVNSPCNPSGVVWTAAELGLLARLAAERDLWIVSDEIYRRLTYGGGAAASPASLAAETRARTAIVDGASKAFAMTGYRIGYLAGDRKLVDAVARFHSQMTGAPNTVSQAAFEAALASEPPEVARMAAEFERRRDALLAGLARLGLHAPRPDGAFYVFPSVSEHLDARGSESFCRELLEREHLALVPGTAFGMEGHVRLSYALSMEKIGVALGRLERFLSRAKAGATRV